MQDLGTTTRYMLLLSDMMDQLTQLQISNPANRLFGRDARVMAAASNCVVCCLPLPIIDRGAEKISRTNSLAGPRRPRRPFHPG